MTALKQFERLEASGLWRPDPADQRREVVVSLGDATLTITDIPGRVLAHWSIAAIVRTNGTALPAIYHPDGDPGETLELDADQVEMIDGIDRLLRAINRRRPHPGKLRWVIGGSLLAAAVAASVFWLPNALKSYAVSVVPEVKRAEIGVRLLEDMTRVTGQPCRAPIARSALQKMAGRTLGPDRSNSIIVVRDGVRSALHLPGHIVLLNRELIEQRDDPDIVAGFILSQESLAARNDPLRSILNHVGLMSTLKLLTTGELPQDDLSDYAEFALVQEQPPVDQNDLVQRFGAAGIRSSSFAYDLDPTGESTLALIEGDPANSGAASDIMSDGDWLRLQAICDR